MWVFYTVGKTVEKLYGNAFFLVIYLASAIFSGLLSIAINGDKVVSAGASGAIFGVFGALLAYLIMQKKEVPETVLKSLMKRGVSLVAYNIVFGLIRPGTDNAAHFGGVISGFMLGLVLARPLNLDLRKLGAERRLAIGIVSSTLAIVLICVALPKSAYSYKGEMAFSDVARAFSPKEEQAIKDLNDLFGRLGKGDVTQTAMADKLESDCLPVWRDFHHRFSSVDLSDKSPSFRMRNLAVDYTKTRGDAVQCLIEGLRTNVGDKFDCYRSGESAAEKLIQEINTLATKK
jgi:rhomboid protease GluP